MSNRLPDLRRATRPREAGRKRNVGGLVSALEPVLGARHGLWLGWSGRITAEQEPGPIGLDDELRPALAWMDFPERWHRSYYNGFCNRALWPLFHMFPQHVAFVDDEWDCYQEVNRAFAAAASELVPPETPVWLHDYHLLLAAQGLRELGHRGPLGLFLHIPFPGPDLFALLPWAEQLLDAMLDFDLLGFHTAAYVDNFLHTVGALSPGEGFGRCGRAPWAAGPGASVPARDHPRVVPGAGRPGGRRGGRHAAAGDRAEPAGAGRRSAGLHQGHPRAARGLRSPAGAASRVAWPRLAGADLGPLAGGRTRVR